MIFKKGFAVRCGKEGLHREHGLCSNIISRGSMMYL